MKLFLYWNLSVWILHSWNHTLYLSIDKIKRFIWSHPCSANVIESRERERECVFQQQRRLSACQHSIVDILIGFVSRGAEWRGCDCDVRGNTAISCFLTGVPQHMDTNGGELMWFPDLRTFRGIFFTFMWPYIVTNFFIIKPTRCSNFPYYSGMKLYMFRAVPLPIIRSLCTVHSTLDQEGTAVPSWQRNCPKHVEFHAGVYLGNWCIWLVLS